jgi:hypothetical protein
MAKTTRNFIQGRMNKSVDERLVPQGEYIHAQNVRLGSTENSEIGSVENSKGNELLVTPRFNGTAHAWQCLGCYADSANETIYWFIHASLTGVGATSKMDMIVSYNTLTQVETNHIVSIDDGGGSNTTLNFNPTYLINGVNKVDNLLFFTDNFNPPRFIDVDARYALPSGNIDGFNAEDILVIKKPPVAAPTLELFDTAEEETYLEERFICFAYRYRYANNEYSATSQWTLPAFTPQTFNLSLESTLNEGMVNQFNACRISYNTGSSLVKEIQILFKESDSNTIKVIESFNKQELGFGDNNIQTVLFDNSKIFTILADSEILRLYDNVPLLAKAQTIMGNRLMYGNYYEGYDLVNSAGNSIVFDYIADLVSVNIQRSELNTATTSSTYNIDCTSGSPASVSVGNSLLTTHLTDDGLSTGDPLDLKANSILEFEIEFQHSIYGGNTSGSFSAPTTTTPQTNLTISFVLPRDYTSAFDLGTSEEFLAFMGNPLNIQTVANCASGITMTDEFNCSLPAQQSGASGGSNTTLSKCWSGTQDLSCSGNTTSPFSTQFATLGVSTDNTSSTFLGIQLMAMAYTDTCPQTGGSVATQVVYEYYEIVLSQASFQSTVRTGSLKSNRNYEAAIVYMDEFNRSSTPIVSAFNTVAVPCSAAPNKNSIKITIPSTMNPPSWATTYKFVVQPDRSTYHTIYSNLFFKDPNTTRVWFLLEGENAQKVEKGDRLIVKRDTNGATTNCIYTTVLEKEVQIQDFIKIPIAGTSPVLYESIPPGAYVALTPTNWAANVSENTIFNPGTAGFKSDCNFLSNPSIASCCGPDGYYVLSVFDQTVSTPSNTSPQYKDVDIPQGSTINMSFEFKRRGPGDGNRNCERVIYNLELKNLVSQNNYANFYDWFTGDNIESLLNTGAWEVGDSGADGSFQLIDWPVTGEPIYYGDTATLCQTVQTVTNSSVMGEAVKDFKMMFFRVNNAAGNANSDNRLGMFVKGGRACGSNENRRSSLRMSVTVFKSESTVVFETEPIDAAPGIFFEGSQTFDITNNFHMSGTAPTDQNQTATLPAIISLDFMNCYSFGNGVESYKVRDSIEGKSIQLGNRVYGASEQIYKRAHRFADITYSGIYLDESNINKLNEFNLGLVNFKQLEDIYGPVEVISGRKTDVLTLQEDKVSYVLAGKNLLSDAAGGSALTSVPEVLGTQIARIEKYGISSNPESYTEWGADKFFTDAKRGAVIQLKGQAARDENLGVISEVGMRGYFRDLFNESFNYQKIGGFDPYMNEYVLSFNTNQLPLDDICYACGVSQTFTVVQGTPQTFCFTLTEVGGNARLNYAFGDGSGSTTTITANWTDAAGNAATATSGAVNTDGFITVLRDIPTITRVDVTVTQTTGNQVVTLTQDCPLAATLNVVQITLTQPSEVGQSIYNQYYWQRFANPQPAIPTTVTPQYTSATTSNFITFASGVSAPTVSQYQITTGLTGTGEFPPSNAYVAIQSNKLAPSDFVFSPTLDSFRYLESNTLYQNNATDINALLVAASTTNVQTVTAGQLYRGQFARTQNATYLYLIWDYRSIQAQQFRFATGTANPSVDKFNACCINPLQSFFPNGSTLSSSSVVYQNLQQTVPASDGYYSDGSVVRLQKLSVLQPQDNCFCGVVCNSNQFIFWRGAVLRVNKAVHTLGTNTGAVEIIFDPWDVPVGIQVQYNGINYNKWYSIQHGELYPNSINTPVYLGQSGYGTLPIAGTYQVAELTNTYQFVDIPGDTDYVTVGPGSIRLTPSNPNECRLVVPKPGSTVNEIKITVFNLISHNESLQKNYRVSCPTNFTAHPASAITRSTDTAACLDSKTINIYIRPGTSIGVNSQIYANEFGDLAVNTDPTSPGYGNRLYSAGGWIRIDQGGSPGNFTAIQLSDDSMVIAANTNCAP